jgi:hypothetical protein
LAGGGSDSPSRSGGRQQEEISSVEEYQEVTVTKRVKYLDPREIDETLAEVAKIARRENVDVAVVGGVAMMVYGSDRLTKDVDVASVDEYLPGLEEVRQLSFGGVVVRTPRGREFDLIVREDEYRELYNAAVDSARDEGLPLRVITPEYLLATKMAAARDKDLLDVKFLVGSGVVDLKAARQIVREHLGEYAARELDAMVAEVEWRKGRQE